METIGQTSTRSESGEPVDRIKERKKRRSRGNTLAKKEKKQFTEIWSLRSSDFKKKEKRVPEKRKERPNRASTEKIQIQAESQQPYQQKQQLRLQLFSSKKDRVNYNITRAFIRAMMFAFLWLLLSSWSAGLICGSWQKKNTEQH